MAGKCFFFCGKIDSHQQKSCSLSHLDVAQSHCGEIGASFIALMPLLLALNHSCFWLAQLNISSGCTTFPLSFILALTVALKNRRVAWDKQFMI